MLIRRYADNAEGFELVEVADPTPPTAEELALHLEGVRQESTAEVKQIRAQALEQWTKNSGVYGVYAENYQAALAQEAGAGDTTTMRDSRTANEYLTALGAKLGKTGPEFGAYIISENRVKVGPTMAQIEERYLALCYAGDAANSITPINYLPTVEAITQAVIDYRSYCGL